MCWDHVTCFDVWLIAATITLFTANVRVMADGYAGTLLHRQEIQQSCCTAVQVTEQNSDYWQTTAQRFQQIHTQQQM